MEQIAQITINSLVKASQIALIGLSFAIIFDVVRFFHLAHAAVFTAGAYLTFLFRVTLGFPLTVSIVFSVAICSLIGLIMDVSIYKPLRRNNSPPLYLLLVSLGIYIVMQNIISMTFGDEIKTLRPGVVSEGLELFGARITFVQILTVLACCSFLIGFEAFMKKTKIGLAMKAVANDINLATISGIDNNRVIQWTFIIGSALGGISGIFMAFDVDMAPTMGMNALMMGVVAIIIGGTRNVWGIVLGAFLVGVAQQAGAWFFGLQWQDTIAFIILLIFLIFRPEGFLGKTIKKATV